MYQKQREKQLDYDNTLYDLEYLIALKEKVIDYKEKNISDNDRFLSARVDKFLAKTAEKISKLERNINEQIAERESCDLDACYLSDLDENKKRLEARKSKYKEVFAKSSLNLDVDRDGVINAPEAWVLENIEDITKFDPIVTVESATHKQEDNEEVVTTTIHPIEFDYSSPVFCYADDRSIIRDRFILYWDRDVDSKTKGEPESEEGFHPENINVAYISQVGRACHLNITDDILGKVRSESGEKSFKLSKPLLPRLVVENDKNKDYYSYQYNEARIKFNRPGSILLYPLDQNEFSTKSVKEIDEIKVESSGSATVKRNKAAFSADLEKPSRNIYLHCTLPEWNHRLRVKLSILQQQINQYKLACHPHVLNMNALSEMKDVLDLHIKYPYQSKNDINSKNNPNVSWVKMHEIYNKHTSANRIGFTKEINQRVQLKNAISDLYNGIEDIISDPSSVSEFSELSIQKKHIERASKELWALLSSKSLLSETKRYISNAKEKIKNGYNIQGIAPPGPYMEDEKGWDKIFITIAECYEALSYSEYYRKKVWNKDLIHGVDSLAAFRRDKNNIDKEVSIIWDRFSEISKIGSESEKEKYIINQSEEFKYNHDELSERSLFGLLISQYGTTAQPYLSYVIPGPGAPCALQVVLSCYQSEFESHVFKRVAQGKITYHLRMYNNVLKIMGLSSKAVVSSPRLPRLMNGLFVRLHLSENNKDMSLAKKEIKKYFSKLNGDLDKGLNKSFYGYFGWDPNSNLQSTKIQRVAGFSKVVYSVLNLAYAIQQLNSITERAENEGWSESKVLLEYINSTISTAIGIGSVANSSINTLRMIKREIFNHRQSLRSSRVRNAQKLLGKVLDINGVVLSVVQTIVSAKDVADHLEQGNDHDALIAGVNAFAGGMVTTGYILQSSIIRGSAYALTLAAAGGTLLVVGTVVGLTILAYQIAEAIKNYTASDHQLILEERWGSFKENKPLTREDVEHYSVSIHRYGGYDNWVISSNRYYDGILGIERVYKEDSIKVYETYFKVKRNELSGIKAYYPVEVVDDKYKEGIFDRSGVRLGKLSWQSVIPLYNEYKENYNEIREKKYSISDIKRLVEIDINWFSDNLNDNISSVEDIIQYYEELISLGRNKIYLCVIRDGEYIAVCDLLETGDFVPKRDDSFYKSFLWEHEAFQLEYQPWSEK